jgi:hypothetical protein
VERGGYRADAAAADLRLVKEFGDFADFVFCHCHLLATSKFQILLFALAL